MKFRTFLELGRVSNLPTVLSNVLTGSVLGAGHLAWGAGQWVAPGVAALASVLFYVGGMFLNDAFDAPWEVTGLGYASASLLQWSSMGAGAGSSTVYDLLRGDLGGLRAGVPVANAACLASGLTVAAFDDPAVPGVQAGYYYLAQAQNACGAGGYGAATDGSPRSHTPCP